MELAGFIIVFLACMAVAKVINAALKRPAVNGAGSFLLLAAVFVVWNIYMASQSKLGPYEVGHAFGRNIGPLLVVSAAAAYYFFKFRSDKAHHLHVQRLRQQRAEGEV